jgi:hypothetical protein
MVGCSELYDSFWSKRADVSRDDVCCRHLSQWVQVVEEVYCDRRQKDKTGGVCLGMIE